MSSHPPGRGGRHPHAQRGRGGLRQRGPSSTNQRPSDHHEMSSGAGRRGGPRHRGPSSTNQRPSDQHEMPGGATGRPGGAGRRGGPRHRGPSSTNQRPSDQHEMPGGATGRPGGAGRRGGPRHRRPFSTNQRPSDQHEMPSGAAGGDGGAQQQHQAVQGESRQRGRGQWKYQVDKWTSRAPQPHQMQFLTQPDIERLSESDSETIVQCINENEPGFLAAYNHRYFCTHPVLLKHLVMILYKLAKANDDNISLRVLAQVLSASGKYTLFLMQLRMLITKMPSETRTHIKRENPQYLHYLIEIGLFAIEHIPRTVEYVYPVEVIKGTVDMLVKNREHNLDTLVSRVELLIGEFESARTEQRQPLHAQQDDSDSDAKPEPNPPEHFTELPVLPEVEDIQPLAPEPFLRHNRVKKGYNDWDHYLDVQFRLLRGDFVEPLRKGITQYHNGEKLTDVRVYEQVSVLQPVCLFSGMGFQIRFDVTKLKRVNWEYTKRLIYGSLLCLSSDNFQTVLFATVVKREAELLQDGYLTIKFEDETNGFQLDPSVVYTMVESSAYFEAYRHVLTGLQNASKNGQADMLPFKQYIVEIQLGDIPMPSYLRSAKFSLQDTISDVKSSTNALSSITLTADCSKWPSCELTCLDPSQYEAFKVAVTREISVIQGPPGTGKTFIGVKIVEAFLKNRIAWDPRKTSPICVVCYTNHALDQFLEDIKRTKIEGKEPNIIRIGGRCKTESLKSCVLREKVDAVRAQRLLPTRLQRPLAGALQRLRTIKDDIGLFQEHLDISDGKVLSLSSLENFVSKDHFNQLINGMPTDPGKEIDVWLGLWHSQYSNEEFLSSTTEPVDSFTSAQPQEGVPFQEVLPEDDFIEVDAEARILEEDRILEGEELELEPQTLANYSQPALEENESAPDQTQDGWKTVQISDSKRRRLIREGYTQDPMNVHDVRQVRDIWSLNKKDRWKLYKYWVNNFVHYQKAQLVTLGQQYNEACELYSRCQRAIYSHVMLGADVIGITTTGAAKHQEILQEMYPKILVIEEAAEVFEAHVVSSLRSSVQHLIMIGDHKQLRPKSNCYKIGEKYGLNISLFERLAMNGLNVLSLEVQHRMKPEIADLIRPCIYPKLSDHEEDTKHDDILGVGKNLFAIDHDVPEEHNDANDLKSHSNHFEADYLVALCKYLLNQEYKPSQITLLTMYRGQLLELRRRMKRKDFQGVRVAAVDDFQGEENDIILLSLVRSNSNGDVGFLKVENRVCVSLSRAKKGLYIIGNFSMLRDKHDTIWPAILTTLEQKKSIGNALPLYCQLHPNKKVAARKPEDFHKCPEGGCQQRCATRLQCGHTCPRLCHPYDRKHEKYKCKKQCIKILSCGHQCLSRCHLCTDGCPPCFEPVEKIISHCGHKVEIACSVDVASVECPMLCDKQLSCGHMCQKLCSKPCTVLCYAETEKVLSCGHKAKDYCYTNPKDIVCQEKCDAKLDCFHPCSGTCGLCHKGRLHIRCQSECGRTLVCGHFCEFPCTPNCPPCLQKCKNYCVHSKCPKRCYELCSPCIEACKWKCEHFQCTRPCGEYCNRPPCNFPCKLRLKCGHPCIGLCGEKCPKQCRICDKDEVCEIFFGSEDEPDARFIQLHDCGHIFEVEGLDTWMKTEIDDAPQEVQFKVCPQCSTEVRTSLRYGNEIKQTLLDHEEIKKKQLEACSSDFKRQFQNVYAQARKSPCYSVIEEELKLIESDIWPPKKAMPKLFPHRINAIATQLTFLPLVLEISEQLSSLRSQCLFSSQCLIKTEDIRCDLQTVLAFLMQQLPSEQQVSDAQCELRRLSCITKLCDLSCKVADKKITLEPGEISKLEKTVSDVYYSGLSTAEKLSERQESEVCEFIALISKKYKVDGLSEKQRMEIIKAIGLSKGHWYKCPNGHMYCIGECGGAMEKGNCPECGATIGGQNHALAAGNVHAPEMDNSRHAAWSEAANLLNFDRQELEHID